MGHDAGEDVGVGSEDPDHREGLLGAPEDVSDAHPPSDGIPLAEQLLGEGVGDDDESPILADLRRGEVASGDELAGGIPGPARGIPLGLDVADTFALEVQVHCELEVEQRLLHAGKGSDTLGLPGRDLRLVPPRWTAVALVMDAHGRPPPCSS
jgi:hypothetical protein